LTAFIDYLANPRIPARRLAIVHAAGALIGIAIAVAALLLAA
jgi:hypothetical protein